MKKSIQLIALVAVALLGSCSGGEKDKATAEKVDEKPRVKLASVAADLCLIPHTTETDPHIFFI